MEPNVHKSSRKRMIPDPCLLCSSESLLIKYLSSNQLAAIDSKLSVNICKYLSECDSSIELMQHLLHLIATAHKTDNCSLYLFSGKERCLRKYISIRNRKGGDSDKKVLLNNNSKIAISFLNNRMIIFERPLDKDILAQKVSLQYDKKYSLCLPLSIDGHVIGVFYAEKLAKTNPYEMASIKLLKENANKIARFLALFIKCKHFHLISHSQKAALANELHDVLAHLLLILKINLRSIQQAIPHIKPETYNDLNGCLTLLDESFEEIRNIIFNLKLQDTGNLNSIGMIEQYIKQFIKLTGVSIDFNCNVSESDISFDIGLFLYRTVRESLINVAKHSRAKNVHIKLYSSEQSLKLLISDDGIGFCSQQGQGLWGIGIASMRDRVKSYNGKFNIKSAEGKGTTIAISIPLKDKFRRSRGVARYHSARG